MQFINREKEIELLEEEYEKDRASFIIIYGRRRIGKTRLIEEFIKDKKEYIYYLASDENEQLQIKEFKERIARFFNDSFLYSQDIRDWKLLFDYLEKIWPRDKKLILIIDEFTYLIKSNRSITSYLQSFWDRVLKKTKTKLIICGSIVKLMLEKVLVHGSPLYGRRTLDILLEELKIKDIAKWLNMNFMDFENVIKFWAIVGGIPKYLELTDNNFENFLKKILSRNSFFYREGYYLMAEELKDISTYLNIMKGLSEGNNKINELSNFTGIESKKLYPYLEVLESLNFIRREEPLFGKRKTLFFINDNFLDFWFRFIHKYRSDIEIEDLNMDQHIKNEINSFIGKKFELLCRKYSNAFFKGFTRIGKQWGKIPRQLRLREGIEKGKDAYEIDILAINEKSKELLASECKWKSKVNALRVIKGLADKVRHLDWYNNNRKESFAIFAKSFSKRIKSFKGKRVYCFDLRDLEKVLKRKGF